MANYPQAAHSAGGKRMFPLMLNGVEVRTLEDLRGNFDLEGVVGYFQSGELLTWLENRFYDDEADAIKNIDADDRNLTAKICAALDVECDIYLYFMCRLPEKKARLAELTDDENIIDNAAATALNQEDLATLIQMDYKTIYLCGENFNVPIRVAGVRYVGVLSTPKIKIRAQSQDELDAAGITFENVQLCLTIDKLKDLAEKIFQTGGKWPIVKDGKQVSTFDQLDKTEKSMVLRMVCEGNYPEQRIAYLQVTDDLSAGFVFTTDFFCTGGGISYTGYNKVLYEEFVDAKIDNDALTIRAIGRVDRIYNCKSEACKKLFSASDYEKLKNFLEVAKTF